MEGKVEGVVVVMVVKDEGKLNVNVQEAIGIAMEAGRVAAAEARESRLAAGGGEMSAWEGIAIAMAAGRLAAAKRS